MSASPIAASSADSDTSVHEGHEDPKLQARQEEEQQTSTNPMLHAAHQHFQQKKYDMCLVTLHTLSQAEGDSSHQEAEALATMCRIYKHSAVQAWHKVLGVAGHAPEAVVKRQYRKLAAQTHPDKCHLEGAEEAFKLLGKAVAHVLSTATNTEAASDGETGPAAAWWEEWEEQHPSSRKRKHPTSKPTFEDEQQDHKLANMSTQELQAEVRKRQAAVLRPEPGSEEEQLSAFERQKRLRIARTVLGQHLQRTKASIGRGFC